MKQAEWERAVLEGAPRDAPGNQVERAIAIHTKDEAASYSREDVQQTLQTLTTIMFPDGGEGASSGRFRNEGPPSPLDEFRRKPSAAILAHVGWNRLEEWADDLRRELEERSADPVELPLPDYGAAVEWIQREQAAASWPETDLSELMEQAAAVNEDAGVEVGVHVQRHPVPYVLGGAEWTRQAEGPKGSALWTLGKAVDRTAPGTPFSSRALVGFVLADLRDPLVPVSVETSIHSTGHREVRLTVRVPDLTERDLRDLRDWIRGGWGARGSRSFTEKDRHVVEVVEEMGGQEAIDALERGENRPFWEEARQRLAERGVEYSRYQSVTQAWERARDRIARWMDGAADVGAEAETGRDRR